MSWKVWGSLVVIVLAATGWAVSQGKLALPAASDLTKYGISAPKKNGKNGPAGNAKGGAPAAAPVEVATARKSEATDDIRAIGSLQSDESVRLASEIAGRVQEVVFAEGQPIKQGDVVIKLDDALARGELAQAEARLKLAAANNQRARALSRSGNVTERAQDEVQATFETSTAEVELARTRVAKHVLRAPFDGVAGIRSVSVGAFVNAGTAIVNIEKIDSLKVDFKVPELYLSAIRTGQEVTVEVDALPGRKFAGAIYAIDPAVDVNGRALSIRARVRNDDRALRPGLFARLNIQGLVKRQAVMVPESAIVPRGGENFVFVVEGGKAREVGVKLGVRRNADVEISEGLAAGATVVVAGQQRLRDGLAVEVVPAPEAPRAPGGTASSSPTRS